MEDQEQPKVETTETGTTSAETKAYALKVTLDAPGLLDAMSLEELEKAVNLARARYVYACQQKTKWEQESYTRCTEFNSALLAQAKRIHGITDDQLQNKPKTAIWSYAE